MLSQWASISCFRGGCLSGLLWLALGNGDGTFQSSQMTFIDMAPSLPMVGDVDSDGALDVVIATARAHHSPVVLLGNGDGTFQQERSVSTEGLHGFSYLVDINDDGTLDLLGADYDSVATMLGNGDGTFLGGQRFVTGGDTSTIQVGDINNDDLMDIVTANDRSIFSLIGRDRRDPLRESSEFSSEKPLLQLL